MPTYPPKIEVVGIVLAVESSVYESSDPGYDPQEDCANRLEALGFDVQSVNLHPDGMFRVEVIA